jgi:nitrate reductase assembly molybdenum cofactor insertion protein NarJ
VARPRARADEQQQLVNIEEDVAIFLGAMQSEQKKYAHTLHSLLFFVSVAHQHWPMGVREQYTLQ